MNRLKLLSLPKIRFAHSFESEEYHNVLDPRENRIEISYIAEGSSVLSQGDSRWTLEKGDVVCHLHRYPLRNDANSYHCHHTVAFTVEFNQPDGDFWIFRANAPGNHTARYTAMIDEIIRINHLYPEQTLRSTGVFLQLLNELMQDSREELRQCGAGEMLYVKKAKKYIYEHIREPMRQKEIAAYLGITPEYLCTVFKKCEGNTLIGFINQTKLNNMKLLMESERLPLCQVAPIYGFSDPNYVSRLYKKYFKTTLTDALRSNRQEGVDEQ